MSEVDPFTGQLNLQVYPITWEFTMNKSERQAGASLTYQSNLFTNHKLHFSFISVKPKIIGDLKVDSNIG